MSDPNAYRVKQDRFRLYLNLSDAQILCYAISCFHNQMKNSDAKARGYVERMMLVREAIIHAKRGEQDVHL